MTRSSSKSTSHQTTTAPVSTKGATATADTEEEAVIPSASAAAIASTLAGAAPVTPVNPIPRGSMPLPDPTTKIPTVDSNFRPSPKGTYTGVLPRMVEVQALKRAIDDMQNMTKATYQETFGKTAPPYDQMLQLMIATYAWSSMGLSLETFGEFVMEFVGMCWTRLRDDQSQLAPAFELSAKADPTMRTVNPGMTALFSVKSSIAKKGATTRQQNQEAEARGEPPTHGKVGKARQRKAANEALAKQQAADAAAKAAQNGTSNGQGTQPSATPATTGTSTTNGATGTSK